MATKLLYIGNDLRSPGSLPTGIQELSRNLRPEGYTIVTASGKQGKLWRMIEMLGSVLRHRDADFVLIDTYSTWNFWYAYAVSLLCRKLGLRYIPLLHGGELPKRLESSPKASTALFAHAHMNVAPSRFLQGIFQQAGYRVTYIPNSIDLPEYAFKARMDLHPKLLWVRAFQDIYNPFLALQTLQVLLQKYPDAELCMVGPGKDNSLEQCRKYSKEQRLPVSFPGKLSKPEWIALSREYDLFLNTTNIDNTPLSLLEAMALGLPVVSTNVGGIPYLLDHEKDALLVPPNDPEALATAILRLLEYPSLAQRLSRNGRGKVEAFDWMQVRKEWADLLGNS